MNNSESSQSVRVAVNVRPLVKAELLVGCTDCMTILSEQKQVQIGSHSFTFDYVFGSTGSPTSTIFDECVAPLVDALFHGYNGTVLAYGQTGSGKTYTMNGEKHGNAIIPKVMDTIFKKVETMKESTECLIRVSFVEVFKEDVFDLLDPKTTGPSRVPIQIREKGKGGITLAGVTESVVRTKKEMASYLLQGSQSRATGSTKMNSQSSLSHAIFTISMEQRRITNSSAGDDVLIAKLHLVDLAGSERAKRTGADRSRCQEGIHINKGLLALGNVISALGDDKTRKEGGHVPYRDSKLTRILQDSLGGNCKTIMIACVSPADSNAEETLNTLKYADRARNIQNKINRDPAAVEMQRLRSQIKQLESELLYFRKPEENDGVVEDVEKELEHSSIQEQLETELQDLNKNREQKEAEMKCFASGDTSVQQYEKKIHELQNSICIQQKEIEELKYKHANSNSDAKEEEYIQKLNFLEKQVTDLKKKKEKSDEAAKKLNDELQKIKNQKIQLRHKIKQESKHFRQWKASREKEVLQLKKEGRKNGYEMHKLLALNQRQKLVLQRKFEAAKMTTKRLKKLLDSRKASSRETSGVGSNKGPGILVLVQTIEHELEVTIGVHEVRSEYKRQKKERAIMSEELARLKAEALIEKQQNFSEFPEAMSPGARNSRILSLEDMLATSSITLVSMESQLSEAEERERAFSDKGRWNQVRSLTEAKHVMNILFNLVSSSRCQLRDRVDCREKDTEISDLKEERLRNEGSGNMTSNNDKHAYGLRPKGCGSSTFLSSGAYDLELLEDTDTSDDEQPNQENDEDREWGHTIERKRIRKEWCICSRSSTCQTSRCKCHSAKGSCSSSCSCATNKCRNREASKKHLSENMSLHEEAEAETSHDLAAHGAMLLGSALFEKPANQNTDGTLRKPLSDI